MRALGVPLATVLILIGVVLSPPSVIEVRSGSRTHLYCLAPELFGGLSREPRDVVAWIPTAVCGLLAIIVIRTLVRRASRRR